ASVSLLCSTEGQYAQGAMAARSGKDGAMAWVCRSTSPLRAGPGAVTAAGGTAVSRLGTAATTCAPPRSLVLRRPAHKSTGRFQKCQWYDQNRVTGDPYAYTRHMACSVKSRLITMSLIIAKVVLVPCHCGRRQRLAAGKGAR